MPIMPGISLESTHHHGGRFQPNPIGIVCHRTECSFDQARRGFVSGSESVHFLIGPGNAVQFVGTKVCESAKAGESRGVGAEPMQCRSGCGRSCGVTK
jgi:hypothetical protein